MVRRAPNSLLHACFSRRRVVGGGGFIVSPFGLQKGPAAHHPGVRRFVSDMPAPGGSACQDTVGPDARIAPIL